jgi:hypothetical protein
LYRVMLINCRALLRRLLSSSTTSGAVATSPSGKVSPEQGFVRLIDEHGRNQGFVSRERIAVPSGHTLRQVAPDTVRLVVVMPKVDPRLPGFDQNDWPGGNQEERPKKKKPPVMISKELRIRPAIGEADLDRVVGKIGCWLQASVRGDKDPNRDGHSGATCQVTLVVLKEHGGKAWVRRRSADQLLAGLLERIRQDHPGARFSAVERRARELVCLITSPIALAGTDGAGSNPRSANQSASPSQ